MIEPEHDLGVKFEGRDVVWSNDLKGTVWAIDSNDKTVARFDNDSAEQVMLSRGTVQDLDDLMFLLGFREYETADSGVEIVENYKERGAHLRPLRSWLKDARDDRPAALWSVRPRTRSRRSWPPGDAIRGRGTAPGRLRHRSLPAGDSDRGPKRQIAENRRNSRNRGRSGRGGGVGGGLGP